MKAYRLFLLAAAAVAVAACAKSNVPSGGSGEADKPVQEEVYSLDVSLPGSEEVKTFLGAYGATTPNVYDILWKTGDKVKVNGVLSNGIDAKYNGQKRANFSFASALEAPYNVVYPGQSVSGDVITVPSEQTYVAGSFDPLAAPMYASSATAIENLSMQNLTGTVCLMMTGTDKITSVELNAIGGEPLAGQVTLQKKNGLYDGSFSVTSPASTITLGCGSGVQLSSTATPLYIPVLAQKYTQGFIAKLYNASGSYMQLKFWNSAAKTVSGTALYKFEEKEFLAGREDVLVLLEDMGVEENSFDTKITVGCYNVWSSSMRKKFYDARNNPSSEYYYTGDGVFVDNDPRLWENSRSYVAKAIVDCGYDVFGVCEVETDNMKTDLESTVASAGGNFTWHHFNLNGSNGNDGYESIAYNPNIFEETGSGQKWLTENGNVRKYPSGHSGWEEGNYRMISYSFLRHKVTGRTIMFCHCHAPLNDDYNTWSGDNAPTLVNSANPNHYPVIFVGDLNSCPNASSYGNGRMYEKLLNTWKHAYVEADNAGVLKSSEREYNCTWEGERGQKSMLKSEDHPFKHQLDHIFYSGDFTILNYRTNRMTHKEPYAPASSGYRNFYPSDHVPVVAELSL